MELKSYTKSQLQEFISSKQFEEMKSIPISRHRALSHINNPNAGENDPLLFIAWDENKMIAYSGVIPDEVVLEGKKQKCGWFSLFWVDENYRGKGIGKQIMGFAISSWNDKIMASDYVPSTKAIYIKTGKFNEIPPKEGLRCFMKFNLFEILPPKNPVFRIMKPLLFLADLFLNFFFSVRLVFYKKQEFNTGISFRETKTVKDELNPIIEKYNKSISGKTAVDLNWIIKYPWILSPDNEKERKRFYFSSYTTRFENKVYEIVKNGDLVGLVMFTIRNKNLKIPYCFCSESESEDVAKFIIQLMREEKLNMITLFHPGICEQLKKMKTPFIAKRKFNRYYFIGKYFNTTSVFLNDGDGDCGWV